MALQFGADAADRFAAERQMRRGIGGFDRLDDGLRGACGIAGLAAVGFVILLAPDASCGRVVRDVGFGLLQRATGEIGSEAAWFHDDHFDAEGFHLLPQPLR